MPAERYCEQDSDGNNNDPVYLLNADPADPQSAYVLGDFKIPLQDPAMLCRVPTHRVCASPLSGDFPHTQIVGISQLSCCLEGFSMPSCKVNRQSWQKQMF